MLGFNNGSTVFIHVRGNGEKPVLFSHLLQTNKSGNHLHVQKMFVLPHVTVRGKSR